MGLYSWTDINPVAEGEVTDRTHYDIIWSNVQYLAEGQRLNSEDDSTVIFGLLTPPTGWIRHTSWVDGLMLVYRTAAVPASGGADGFVDHAHDPGTLTSGAASNTHTHSMSGKTTAAGNGSHSVSSITCAADYPHTHNTGDHYHGEGTLAMAGTMEHLHQWYNDVSGGDDKIWTYDDAYPGDPNTIWGMYEHVVGGSVDIPKNYSYLSIVKGSALTLSTDAYTSLAGADSELAFKDPVTQDSYWRNAYVTYDEAHIHTLNAVTDDHTHSITGAVGADDGTHTHSISGESEAPTTPKYQEVIAAYRGGD